MSDGWTKIKTQDLRVGDRVRLGKREGTILAIEPGRMKSTKITIDDKGKPLVGLPGAPWDARRTGGPESAEPAGSISEDSATQSMGVPPTAPSKKGGKGKMIAGIVGAFIVLGIVINLFDSGGDDSAAPASSSAPAVSSTTAPVVPSTTVEPSPTPSTTVVDNVAEGKRIANKIIKNKIGLKAIGFPCDWQERKNDAGLVYMTACEKHGILLATSPNHSDVQDWMHSMQDQMDSGYGVLGHHYAVTTVSKANQNRLWDLLGADGERVDL